MDFTIVVLFAFSIFVIALISQLFKQKDNIPISQGGNSSSQVKDKTAQLSTNLECNINGNFEERKSKPLKILYGTQSGTAKTWAHELAAQAKGYDVTVVDLSTYDPDELNDETFVLFVLSTYTDGRPPDNCVAFYNWLQDLSLDFRVPKTYFQSIKYAIFGIGSSVYDSDKFNKFAKDIDKMMKRLSAQVKIIDHFSSYDLCSFLQQIVDVGLGDNGAGVEISQSFNVWTKKLWNAMQTLEGF
jgi:MioC protein